jgi:monothiol glutaredoxin
MGIRKRVKRLVLPLIGRSASPPEDPAVPAPRRKPVAQPVYEEPKPPRPTDVDAKTWIQGQVTDNPLVLFMKGNAGQPQCGFSANAVGILSSYGKKLHTVDVLLDPDVRSAVKAFSDWPTIPQVYIGGEFVGGSDILSQMHASGDLKDQLEAAFTE